jgi:hypothetical protein
MTGGVSAKTLRLRAIRALGRDASATECAAYYRGIGDEESALVLCPPSGQKSRRRGQSRPIDPPPLAPDAVAFVRDEFQHEDGSVPLTYMRVNSFQALLRGKRRVLMDHQEEAARLYLADWEISQGAIASPAFEPAVDGSASDGLSEARLNAVRRLKQAQQFLGDEYQARIDNVLIYGWTARTLAARFQKDSRVISTLIEVAMDRLVEFYTPHLKPRARDAVPLGPMVRS